MQYYNNNWRKAVKQITVAVNRVHDEGNKFITKTVFPLVNYIKQYVTPYLSNKGF
jgi:hypothetical protein